MVCMNVRMIVKYWVNWVDFLWFIFFCFVYFENLGIIFICSNCIMMEVVIYGVIFIVKIEKCCNVFLLNMFNIFRMLVWFCIFNIFVLVWGIGINVLIWKMINIVSVKRIFFFILVIFMKFEIVWNIMLFFIFLLVKNWLLYFMK